MNANLKQEFKQIFDKHFNFKDKKVLWEDFESDWNKVLFGHAELISSEEKDFLNSVFEEVYDISNHMPGKNGKSSELDWNKWTSDDEYLTFLLSREALLFPMSKEGYFRVVEGAVKSGLFARPFRDEIKYISKIHRYLSNFIAASDEKKYRIVKVVHLHPEGTKTDILERGLSIDEAMNKSLGYASDGLVSSEIPYFEEDI